MRASHIATRYTDASGGASGDETGVKQIVSAKLSYCTGRNILMVA